MVFRLFPALFDKPEGIHYCEQEPNENIELFLRAHWITNVPWIFTALFGFALPIVIIIVDQSMNTNYLNYLNWQEMTGAILIWYMLLIAFIIERFVTWYFNVYIVTNLNLVDVNFYSLLFRDIVEIDLGDIESQSSKIKGIMGSFFNFGDVTIESAAKDEDIVFENVPRPDFVSDRIQDLRATIGKKGGKP